MELRENATYRHVKRGTFYKVMGRAKMQIGPESLKQYGYNDGSSIARCEELEKKSFVVYLSLDHGTLWVRPESEFLDGRFVEVK